MSSYISRRSSLMTAFLPITALAPAPQNWGAQIAAPAPADPALSDYRDVMARKDAVEALPNSEWHQVEVWCDDEAAALDALAEQRPGDLAALLNRVAVLAERLEDGAGWNMQDAEAELLRTLGEQARAMLAGSTA